ncbi:MAG: hypothetical protein IT337_03155 [Thermomicrobiales bacterium]|nr:hypothetical protein [Thermomicrobiales bacterium]
MSDVHRPPWLRQQFLAPSPGTPLSAHTTEPPLWLHWLVEVHSAPNANPPVVEPEPSFVPLAFPDPPQKPFTQNAPPQHW